MIWIAIVATLAFVPPNGPALAQGPAAPVAAPPMEMTAAAVAAGNPDAPVERPIVCYSAREMSDRVARLRLYNPLLAMQAQARRQRAEPLRTRLCRSGNRLVYELSLIRRDGKVLPLYVNAQNGRLIAPQ